MNNSYTTCASTEYVTTQITEAIELAMTGSLSVEPRDIAALCP